MPITAARPKFPPVGPARVARLIYRIMPDNAARVAALLAGDVDMINNLPVTAIRQVQANEGTQVAAVNGTRTFFLAINNAKPPFTDVRVRQALNHAVDRKLIIARLLNGLAAPLNGVLSPDAFGFNPDLPEYAYDPAQAKAHARRRRRARSAAHHRYRWRRQGNRRGHRVHARPRRHHRQGAGLGYRRASCRSGASPEKRKDHDLFYTSWGNASLDPSDIMMPAIHAGGRGNTAGYANPKSMRCSMPPKPKPTVTSASALSPGCRRSSTPTRPGSSCGCHRISTASPGG